MNTKKQINQKAFLVSLVILGACMFSIDTSNHILMQILSILGIVVTAPVMMVTGRNLIK